MKRITVILAMALLGLMVGAVIGRIKQARGSEHEHEMSCSTTVQFPPKGGKNCIRDKVCRCTCGHTTVDTDVFVCG